jgi:hypothetical protein
VGVCVVYHFYQPNFPSSQIDLLSFLLLILLLFNKKTLEYNLNFMSHIRKMIGRSTSNVIFVFS